ncbi:dihydroxy-acid dehydratase, partial [Candidatus Bathyarchaeota archaeon]
LVRDGDVVSIDIPKRRLDLKAPAEELRDRLKRWKPPKPKVEGGILAVYSRMVGSTSKGAVFLS